MDGASLSRTDTLQVVVNPDEEAMWNLSTALSNVDDINLKQVTSLWFCYQCSVGIACDASISISFDSILDNVLRVHALPMVTLLRLLVCEQCILDSEPMWVSRPSFICCE